jgi:WD40 repeat protein
LEVWDLKDQRRVGELRPKIPEQDLGLRFGALPTALAVSPGGEYVACAVMRGGGKIHVFKVATGDDVSLPIGHIAESHEWRVVRTLAWSHDGKILASGGADGQVWLWDLATASPLLRCEGHEGPVMALAFARDDRTLLSGSDDTTALVWDLTFVRDSKKRAGH